MLVSKLQLDFFLRTSLFTHVLVFHISYPLILLLCLLLPLVLFYTAPMRKVSCVGHTSRAWDLNSLHHTVSCISVIYHFSPRLMTAIGLVYINTKVGMVCTPVRAL